MLATSHGHPRQHLRIAGPCQRKDGTIPLRIDNYRSRRDRQSPLRIRPGHDDLGRNPGNKGRGHIRRQGKGKGIALPDPIRLGPEGAQRQRHRLRQTGKDRRKAEGCWVGNLGQQPFGQHDLDAKFGHAATSMSDLARAVGIQKASLYHHFPSKEALFVACVTEGYDGAARKLEAIRTDPSLSDPARIRAAMEEVYRINLTTPVGRMPPLIAEVAQQLPDVAQAVHGGFITRHYSTVTGMISDGIARGSFRRVDPMGLQHLIFGPVITLALSREMTATFPDRDTLYPVDMIRETHIDLILQLLLGTQDG